MIRIVQPGPQCTVQDLGRKGLRKIGVGVAGALDTFALRIANIMVGNDEGAAGLECTLGGTELVFEQKTTFALTGADAAATLDGLPVPAWWVRVAPQGATLKLAMPRSGMRSYIAFAGGLDVPLVIGSRSTDLKGGFGGHNGRALSAGDQIGIVKTGSGSSVQGAGFGLAPSRLGLQPVERSQATNVRFVAAAEWAELKASSRDLFTSTDWRIEPDSNRVGYRFTGAPLELTRPLELFSHGILPGTIQLPPSGLPMVQMSDANTCGGYPKLGVVISADLPKLAQASLGTAVRFSECTVDEARSAGAEVEARLQHITRCIDLAKRVVA
jgi:biotin-dependent carboxylase-like uncharacterized protein